MTRLTGSTELRWGRGETLRVVDGDVAGLVNFEVGGARVAAWSEVGARRSEDWFAIQLAGAKAPVVKRAEHVVPLRLGAFDPLRGAPDYGDWTSEGGEVFVVQYPTQPLLEYALALEALGVRVYDSLGGQAQLIRANAPTRAKLSELPFVRWVGAYHPALRVDPILIAALEAGELPYRRYNVQVFERGLEQQQVVANRIAELGGEIHLLVPEGFRFEASMSPAALRAIAALDEVRYVDAWSAPEDDMDVARTFSGANYVESVGGFLGQGVSVEVMDGGIDSGHPDFPNLVQHGPNSASSHGTCTSGIVAGSGGGNFSARGGMPLARLVSADYGFLGNRYAHTAELVNPSLTYRCVLQSNSWGGSLTTSYTTVTAEMDDLIAAHDFLICQSQSNTGNNNSREQAWAKNIVSVGGIRHFGTLSDSDDVWDGGSIGPASDGRLKPDLAHFYDGVLCTDQVGGPGYSSGNYNSSFGGTSAATPITAGMFGLFYEMWHGGVFGAAPGGATAFESRPHFTLAKAALINTATQWNFSGASHNLTRTHQGWGRADLETLYDERLTTFFVDQTDVVNNLASIDYAAEVAPGETELRVTLVYRDAMGAVTSLQHRKNDLTLEVIAPNGTTYFGNNGLNAGMWSTPGGLPNTKDTVENVFVAAPAAGTWTVRVRGDDINTDPVTNAPAASADFALWVTGATSGPVCGAPTVYCAPKVTSALTIPSIGSSGSPSVSSGSFVVTLSGALPLKNCIVFFGAGANAAPFKGGLMCVAPPVLRLPVTSTDAASNAAQSIAVTPGMIGTSLNYQWWFRDPSDGFGVGLSDGLAVTFCD